MKSPLIVASAVVLFVMAGVAHSQGTPQASQPAPQEWIHNAMFFSEGANKDLTAREP